MKVAEFEIEVERKSIKNMHLAVYPPDGRVHISVPQSMKDEDVSMFLFTKLSWIRQQYDAVISQERQSTRQYVSGENHYLFGRRYLLKVVPSTTNYHVELAAPYMKLYVGKNTSTERRRVVMDEFYRSQLNDVLVQYVSKWSALMDEPTATFDWKILLMKKQWGSCLTKERKIMFNLLLARVPLKCIEYVVVHELTHLKVHEHNKDFIMSLNKYMPYWQLNKKELDEFVALPIIAEEYGS